MILLAALAAPPEALAQHPPLDRLPRSLLDVARPSERVRGAPGEMTVRQRTCPTVPTAEARRRILDVALQEWAFFGSPIVEPTEDDDWPPPEDVTAAGDAAREREGPRRRYPRLGAEESARVATSIAGYWAVTPEGPWIVARQNEVWNGRDGIAARWEYPWSAAFVSWVMCETIGTINALFAPGLAGAPGPGRAFTEDPLSDWPEEGV